MTTSYQEITEEDFSKLMPYVSQDYKEFVEHIRQHKSCTVSSLCTTFECEVPDILEAVGRVNGSIFKRFKFCIYPVEVNSIASDSVYAMGRLV